jgi:hypothetical protein
VFASAELAQDTAGIGLVRGFADHRAVDPRHGVRGDEDARVDLRCHGVRLQPRNTLDKLANIANAVALGLVDVRGDDLDAIAGLF